MEPSVEKLKEALREEMRVLKERFLTRNPGSREEGTSESQVLARNGTSKKPAYDVPKEPGEALGEAWEQERLRPVKHHWAGKAFTCRRWTTR
jgi:hypothetical protein